MAGDPYWGNVVLAMHMDGVNGATTFPEIRGKSVSRVGSPIISTGESAFSGGSSLYVPGSGSYLTTPSSTDFDFGTGDFTIECWVYMTTNTGGDHCVISYGNTATGMSWQLLWRFGYGFSFWHNFSVIANTSTYTSYGSWNHVAVTRVSGVVKVYVNGVAGTGGSLTTCNSTTGPVYIGTLFSTGVSKNLNGYVDDVRITKGLARTITVPTEPFMGYRAQILGTIKDDNDTLCSRIVRAYDRSTGAFVGEVSSNATTGAFTIETQSVGLHTVVALDDESGTQYNALVLDRVTPV